MITSRLCQTKPKFFRGLLVSPSQVNLKRRALLSKSS